MVPDTFPSLFAGYAVLWVILLAYVGRLGWKIAKLEKRSERKDLQ